MSSSVRTAVILAAGLGSRLKERTREIPKAFLEIDGQSLIERSIQNLLDKGIDRIIIGTGYLNNYFDDLKKKYPQVITRRNNDFATTGSMYTLYVVRDLIEEDFLLLEGDLLYEESALDLLLTDANPDVILASDATNSGDEVYIQASVKGLLENMSKEKSLLKNISGELVGISKLSLSGLKQLVAYAESKYDQGGKNIHYEDAMVGISSGTQLQVKVASDLAWCEIDDENHLTRALNTVYPKILSRKK